MAFRTLLTKESLEEAKIDKEYAPCTDQNDWGEGWDDAIAYLESEGIIKILQ